MDSLCGGQKWMSVVFLCCFPSYLLRQGHWTWRLLIWPGWLASELHSYPASTPAPPSQPASYWLSPRDEGPRTGVAGILLSRAVSPALPIASFEGNWGWEGILRRQADSWERLRKRTAEHSGREAAFLEPLGRLEQGGTKGGFCTKTEERPLRPGAGGPCPRTMGVTPGNRTLKSSLGLQVVLYFINTEGGGHLE